MMVYVDQPHINEAANKIGRSFYNPIALSLRDKDRFVVVTTTHIHFVNGGIQPLPPDARSWLADFNAGRAVRPFRFEIWGV